MDEENITGYHGTIKEAAKNIIETQKIDNSIGDEEWLGRGKYFYDRYTNAIEYNMKKYNENKNINELISYNNLIINYAILETTIKCAKEDILNLDEIIILSKFVWAWEKIYNKVKENPNFQKLKYRDGYIIDYMINEIPGCKYKVVVKTFDRIYRFISGDEVIYPGEKETTSFLFLVVLISGIIHSVPALTFIGVTT